MTFSTRLWLVLGAVAVLACGIVAFVAFGHSAASGTAAQQLRSWVSSTNLGQDIGTLQDDGTHVQKAVDEHQGTVSIHTVCAAMSNDAQTFNGQLPSPDTQVTQLLARAYGLEYDSAQACYQAGATGTRLLDQAAHDRAEAKTLFGEALARVAAVTGQDVPTTTTTVPGTTSTSFF